MAVPPHLQEAIFTPKSVEEALKHAGENPATSATATGPPAVTDFNGYTSPYSLLPKTVSLGAHSSRHQRLHIPSISPVGIDPYALAQERDLRLKNRIKYRIDELDNLPSNIASEPLDPSAGLLDYENKTPMAGPKLKALIELKSLRLLERQKKVRGASKKKRTDPAFGRSPQ